MGGNLTAVSDVAAVGRIYSNTSYLVPYILYKNTSNVAITGLGYQTLWSFTVPGGTLGTDGVIRIITTGVRTTGTSSVSVRLTYGGSVLVSSINSYALATSASQIFVLYGAGATNSQAAITYGSIGTSAFKYGTSAVDSTADKTLVIEADLTTDTDVVTGYSCIAEVF